MLLMSICKNCPKKICDNGKLKMQATVEKSRVIDQNSGKFEMKFLWQYVLV